jgi:hypothetical protein
MKEELFDCRIAIENIRRKGHVHKYLNVEGNNGKIAKGGPKERQILKSQMQCYSNYD